MLKTFYRRLNSKDHAYSLRNQHSIYRGQAYPIQNALWVHQPYNSECTVGAPTLFRMHSGCTNPIQIMLCAPMHTIQGYTESAPPLCRKYRGRAYAMHNYTMGTSKICRLYRGYSYAMQIIPWAGLYASQIPFLIQSGYITVPLRTFSADSPFLSSRRQSTLVPSFLYTIIASLLSLSLRVTS